MLVPGVCATEGARGNLVTFTPDPTDVLNLQLMDLRANVEAQLRSILATDECVADFKANHGVAALLQALKYLQAIDSLHLANDEAIDHANQEVTALIVESLMPS